MTLRIETLGGLRILHDGAESTRLPRQRLRCALLTFLAVERRGPRERLMHLFWPDHDPRRAQRTLSQMLYELRRSLGEDLIDVRSEPVSAGPELSSDAAEFEALVEGDRFAQAVALYRGPFLRSARLADTAEFDHWVDDRRARLAALYVKAQATNVRALTKRGDLVLALAAARRWALEDPLDGDAQECLIELLARNGLRNEALRQYAAFCDGLARRGDKPFSSVTRLGESVKQGSIPVAIPDDFDSHLKGQLTAKTGIAVLPVANLSRDQANDYFCDGLAEEIIHALGRAPGLRVVPRTSSFALSRRGMGVRQVVSELGVTHALEGSARFFDDRYRVRVALIEGEGEAELWQEQFDGVLGTRNVFELQDQIAESVLSALAGRLDLVSARAGAGARTHAIERRGRDTTDPEAYGLYLQARHAWLTRTLPNLYKAIDLFQQAIARDAKYARAYAGMADVYNVLGGADYATEPPSELYPKARQAAEKALALDRQLAEAHAAVANYQMSYEWDWDEAGESFERAIDLNPGYSSARQWYSNYLMYTGDVDEAVSQATLALELDPRSVFLSSSLARHYQVMRQPERAAEQFRRALELDPTFASARIGLALSEIQAGRPEACLGEIEALAAGADRPTPFLQAIHAYTVARMGDSVRARQLLLELKATEAPYLPPEFVALVYIGLEEEKRALDWFEKALEARSQTLSQLGVEPLVDPVRGSPRFQRLLAAVGL